LPVVSDEQATQLLSNVAGVFNVPNTNAKPDFDVKALHAKIGQQALEIDFLAHALGRGDEPSGKR
jgi:transposase